MRAVRAGTWLSLAVVAVYSWWATGLETFSAESTVAVIGGGVVAVAWGTWRRQLELRQLDQRAGDPSEEDRPRGRKPGLLVWLVLLAVLAVFQTTMYLSAPREDYPTISSIINSALDTHGARMIAYGFWIVGAVRLAGRA